jgi:hypothetical protein
MRAQRLQVGTACDEVDHRRARASAIMSQVGGIGSG